MKNWIRFLNLKDYKIATIEDITEEDLLIKHREIAPNGKKIDDIYCINNMVIPSAIRKRFNFKHNPTILNNYVFNNNYWIKFVFGHNYPSAKYNYYSIHDNSGNNLNGISINAITNKIIDKYINRLSETFLTRAFNFQGVKSSSNSTNGLITKFKVFDQNINFIECKSWINIDNNYFEIVNDVNNAYHQKCYLIHITDDQYLFFAYLHNKFLGAIVTLCPYGNILDCFNLPLYCFKSDNVFRITKFLSISLIDALIITVNNINGDKYYEKMKCNLLAKINERNII